MLDLSGRGDENVKQVCSTALNQVPPDMVQLDDKMVNVLVSLLTATGSTATDDGSIAVPEPSAHDLRPWTLRSASVRENPVQAQPSWINNVCQGFEVRTILYCYSYEYSRRCFWLLLDVATYLQDPRHGDDVSCLCSCQQEEQPQRPTHSSVYTKIY